MKLSIITINFNNSIGLKKTIESVVNQTYNDFEYIIIDGGSSDESINVIKGYKNSITHWISEPDKGVYDAMNKGIKLATGDYLLMLNSGDYLTSNNVLEKILVNGLTKNYDIIYGDVIWEEQGLFTDGSFPNNLTFNYFRYNSLGHQAAFIKKKVHDIVGLYDTSLRIASDWKFFILSICKFNINYRHINTSITVCGRDGMSCDPKNMGLITQERNKVFEENFKVFLSDYILLDKKLNELNLIKNNKLYKIYNLFNKNK